MARKSWCSLLLIFAGTILLLPVVYNVPIDDMVDVKKVRENYKDWQHDSGDESDSSDKSDSRGDQIRSNEGMEMRFQELERQNHILWGMLQKMKTKMQSKNQEQEQMKKDICTSLTNVCGATNTPCLNALTVCNGLK